MAKKEEKIEAQQAAEAAAVAQAPSETPNRDKWMANLRGKYGDDLSEEDLYQRSMESYDEEHDSNKRFISEANDLEEIVKANPELGMVFNEIFERGKDGHPEMALRNLPDELKRYVSDPEYGDEEYIASKKQRQEEEAAKKAKDEQTQALREQAFAEVCEEKGIKDTEAALKALQDVFDNPCETLDQCKEQVRAFLKMAEFDGAVAAAEVRGRNANIAEQRRNVPKTAPTAGAGVAPVAAPKQSKTIFDEARDAE